ncbi:MAG: DNA-binding response regulator [Epsilonproteobacteria bacterium]|nr:DNA-binding response regulator [Campylobacterota bacterium]
MKKVECQILIVEDELARANFIEHTVRALGHKVVGVVSKVDKCLEITKNNHVDFAFIDINLKDKVDGIKCAELINQAKKTPIIYMTDFSDSTTIADAIETNVYGYLIKPFDIQVIESVLGIAIKRAYGLEKGHRNKKYSKTLSLADNYRYNLKTKTFTINHAPIHLTHRESEVLHLLCSNINQNVSYALLRSVVWKNKEVGDSTIRDTLLRLRKKAPLLDIDNIVGMGYCLRGL